MSSITTPNQTISIFIDLHNDLDVLCKQNCFGYWNSGKRLPNFVNLADLIMIMLMIMHQSFATTSPEGQGIAGIMIFPYAKPR